MPYVYTNIPELLDMHMKLTTIDFNKDLFKTETRT